MNLENLIVFNKEGFPLNNVWSGDRWTAKAFFDTNSSDTFKTQAFYLMELVPPASINSEGIAQKFRAYNDGGITYIAGGHNATITEITKTVPTSDFYTKWFTVDNTSAFAKGDMVWIEGFSGDYAQTSGGETLLHEVLDIRGNKIMLMVGAANNSALPSFTYNSTTKLVAANTILALQTGSWSSSALYSDNYIGRIMFDIITKQSMVVKSVTPPMYRSVHTLDVSGLVIGSPTERVALHVTTYLARPSVYTGDVIFDAATSSIYFESGLPPLLTAGSSFVAVDALTNTGTFTVSSVSKSEKIAYLTIAPVDETVESGIELTTNTFVFTSDQIFSRAGSFSAALTAASIVTSNKEALAELGIAATFSGNNIVLTDNRLRTLTTAPYAISAALKRLDVAGSIMETDNATITYDTVYVFDMEETLEDSYRVPTSKVFSSDVLLTLDSEGIEVEIYGNTFSTPFDTNTTTTLSNFISDHAVTLGTTWGIDVVAGVFPSSASPMLTITGYSPELPDPGLKINVGPAATCIFLNKSYTISNIGTDLVITINGTAYSQPFDTDDATTVTNWFNAYKELLKRDGIRVIDGLPYNLVIGADNFIDSNDITSSVSLGYSWLAGEEESMLQLTHISNPVFDAIVGDTIQFVGSNLISTGFSTGMSMVTSGFTNVFQNGKYNIVGLSSDIMTVVGGNYFQDETIDIKIETSEHVRYPRRSTQDIGASSIVVELEKTDDNDKGIFLYDLSGTQLGDEGKLTYVGQKPLVSDTVGEAVLNTLPNKDFSKVNDPLSQQTVFDNLTFELPLIDSEETPENNASPLQIFVGYKSDTEGYDSALLKVSILDQASVLIETDPNTLDDTVTFGSGAITITNTNIDLIAEGFKVGQYIKVDSTSTYLLKNNGSTYRIEEAYRTRLVVTLIEGSFVDEVSYIEKTVTTPPYSDENGPLTDTFGITVRIEAIKTPILNVTLWGETVVEDERLRVALANVGQDITKTDVTILKDFSEDEQGVDWIVYNRLRKDMIEARFDIFGSPGSYRSLEAALKFWGYNNLTLSEYYMNTDEDSHRFGYLVATDVKDSNGWINKASAPIKHMKTNRFRLNMDLTDANGNYIVDDFAASLKKIGRLKSWLERKVISHAQLDDVSGRIIVPSTVRVAHHSLMKTGVKGTSYNYPVTCTVTGYSLPIVPGSNFYDMRIAFDTNADTAPDHMCITVNTFALDTWSATTLYPEGEYTYRNGIVWLSLVNNRGIDPSAPGSSSYWEEATDWSLTTVQRIEAHRYSDMSDLVVTLNKDIDPHMQVEITIYNGYGGSWTDRTLWSLNTGQWP